MVHKTDSQAGVASAVMPALYLDYRNEVGTELEGEALNILVHLHHTPH